MIKTKKLLFYTLHFVFLIPHSTTHTMFLYKKIKTIFTKENIISQKNNPYEPEKILKILNSKNFIQKCKFKEEKYQSIIGSHCYTENEANAKSYLQEFLNFSKKQNFYNDLLYKRVVKILTEGPPEGGFSATLLFGIRIEALRKKFKEKNYEFCSVSVWLNNYKKNFSTCLKELENYRPRKELATMNNRLDLKKTKKEISTLWNFGGPKAFAILENYPRIESFINKGNFIVAKKKLEILERDELLENQDYNLLHNYLEKSK